MKSSDIRLTVCVSAIEERLSDMAVPLVKELSRQARNLPVEVLMLFDNKTRSMAGKFQALCDLARGEYISFVNDDDLVSENYIESILDATKEGPDAISFIVQAQQGSWEKNFRGGVPGDVYAASLGDKNVWPLIPTFPWKRKLIVDSGIKFPERPNRKRCCLIWAEEMGERAQNVVHIDEVLYFFRIRIRPIGK